jgi:hypothetical protein
MLWLLLVLVILFVIVRLAIPPVAVWYANKKLRNIPGYTGHVSDVDLNLLRGYYQVGGISLFLVDSIKPDPVIRVRAMDFHLYWNALVKRKIVGEAKILDPRISVYMRMLKAPKKPEVHQPPGTVVFRRLLPIKIDKLAVRNGEIHFKNYIQAPNFDLYMKDVTIDVANLTNREKGGEPNYARIDMTGLAMGSGKVVMHAAVNPISTPPNFKVTMKMTGLNVTTMNEFAREYAGFDFERGTFDMVTEITVDRGKINGYVKPIFRDLQIFSWSKDVKNKRESIVKKYWEAIVGAAGEIFENQPKDQLATRFAISDTISDPKISVEEAIVNVLRNAFVKAFLPKIEHSVTPPKD